ncbi:MAG: (2Fe-2S) ferredoxin domain-containing protein [Bacteroidota bacterium]
METNVDKALLTYISKITTPLNFELMRYSKHIFICTNQKANPESKCCGEAHGLELVQAFKKLIVDAGVQVDVRAQKAGCLDVCSHGPALVIYPEGVFYGQVGLADVEELFHEHILNNRPVDRLRIKFDKK